MVSPFFLRRRTVYRHVVRGLRLLRTTAWLVLGMAALLVVLVLGLAWLFLHYDQGALLTAGIGRPIDWMVGGLAMLKLGDWLRLLHRRFTSRAQTRP